MKPPAALTWGRGAWKRLGRWLQPPRKLRPTRLGAFFVAGVVALGVAAVNTGNNLLYFILAMFLAAIIVSGILSERNLRGLLVDRDVSAKAGAGEPVTIAFVIVRDRRRLPAFALTLRDRDPESGELGAMVRVPRVDPDATRRRLYSRTFPSRGVHRLEEVEVGTAYPFGLFRKSRRLDLVSSVRVRPRVPDLDLPAAIGGREDGISSTFVRGEGLDLFALRDHQPGDDARRIHWKATARSQSVVVKDPAREEPPQVVVHLRLDGYADDATFERAVEHAAGVASALIREGFGTGFLAGEEWIAPSAQPAALDAILDALVDVVRAERATGTAELRSFDRELSRGAGVVTVGPPDGAPAVAGRAAAPSSAPGAGAR